MLVISNSLSSLVGQLLWYDLSMPWTELEVFSYELNGPIYYDSACVWTCKQAKSDYEICSPVVVIQHIKCT